VGVVSGGNAITAIAAVAAMQVDIRSDDAQELEAMERRILAAVDEAVIAENARWASQALRSERKLIGDRPASSRAVESSVADAAVGAYVALKMPEPRLKFASPTAMYLWVSGFQPPRFMVEAAETRLTRWTSGTSM
jgi:acetylornithine deacetylase/succinyl-diaminopimelate desuccinylase-like protein